MPDDETAKPRRWRQLQIIAFAALAFAVVTSPITLTAFAFWAADGAWEFDGGGLRHWTLVKGSTADRLGVVAAAAQPAHFVVRLAEGTDPGAISVSYESAASPADILAAYANRCEAMGLSATKQTYTDASGQARLVCEGDRTATRAHDVFVRTEHAPHAATTQVHILTGPGLTQTFNF